MTRTFAEKCQDLKREDLVRHHEHYNDVGPVDLYVKTFDHEPVTAANLSFAERLKDFLILEGYMIKRFFQKNTRQYKNLPD
jgi:hypothetical protein